MAPEAIMQEIIIVSPTDRGDIGIIVNSSLSRKFIFLIFNVRLPFNKNFAPDF